MQEDMLTIVRGLVAPNQFAEIVEWNQKRNGLEFSYDLEQNMLNEEMVEFWVSTDVVDKLDAYLDTLFVFVGTLAKSSKPIVTLEDGVMGYKCPNVLPDEIDVGFITPGQFDVMTQTLVGSLLNVGVDGQYVGNVVSEGLDIVIEANNAKLADKDEKGKVKKPKGFVPPENKLKKLIEEYVEKSDKLRKQREAAQSGNLPPLSSQSSVTL